MPDIQSFRKFLKDKKSALRKRLLPDRTLLIISFAAGSGCTLVLVGVYRRYLKRIPTGEWMTPNIWKKKRWIKGKVTAVGDNDNFRLYHMPGFGWRWPLKFRFVPKSREGLQNQTIHIRLAGVDAPEAPHFGRPGQLHAAECMKWLKDDVEGKILYCQLLRRDQYGRMVAFAHHKPRFLPGSLFEGKCVSVEMLRSGWATVYDQAGAEHGRWGKDELLRIEQEAQIARRGIWKHGTKIETPGEYKSRHANSVGQTEVKERLDPETKVRGRAKKPPISKWWSSILRR